MMRRNLQGRPLFFLVSLLCQQIDPSYPLHTNPHDSHLAFDTAPDLHHHASRISTFISLFDVGIDKDTVLS